MIIILEEYKQSYRECAEKIVGYKKLGRDELANKCIEFENTDKYESYLSALILSFWNVIVKNYNTRTYESVSEEDAYNWVVFGILEALKERCWLDETSSVYKDPHGPEKVINIKCFQNKCRYYQTLNYDKRAVLKKSMSLEGISEDASDDYFLPYFDKINVDSLILCEYIKKYFLQKEYLKFFILDAIINSNVFTNELDNFKLRKHLRNLNNRYLNEINQFYQLSIADLIYAKDIVVNIDQTKIDDRIDRILRDLRHDKMFVEILKEG